MRRSFLLFAIVIPAPAFAQAVDFNREVRPILSNNCYACHGPDPAARKGKLRLDLRDEALKALAPGKPETSELVHRVATADASEVMPPAKTGKKLSKAEIDILTRWVKEGANYSKHWAYVTPVRPELPTVKDAAWVKNPIDRFTLARLEKEGLKPSAEADRYALARRLALDLTGLPPTLAEAEAFAKDLSPDAYEKYVDLLLKKDSYGEHWARLWLDLARYADSAGYADDPLRQIWAFRDYVIKSYNANKPFDQFTIEQIAGDLLPKPTEEQIIATAFHRNTMTNNEGGTNDEEYRSVAIVDRVNTTLTTWMGTSIACAQCHDHKYDPITQKEFFGLYAILNNSADADRSDESPVYSFFSESQKKQRALWEAELAAIDKKFKEAGPGLAAARAAWERTLALNPKWVGATPQAAMAMAGALAIRDGAVFAEKAAAKDTYTIELPLSAKRFTGLRLEALTDPKLPGMGPGHAGGNFVVSRVTAQLVAPATARPTGRFVRISLPGANRILSLAEVQVFSGTENVALKGEAKQSSTDYEGPAKLAIDGNTNGQFENKSVTHTKHEADPWWEVDLKGDKTIDRIVLWNRIGGVEERIAGYKLELLNDKREVVWKTDDKVVPKPSVTHDLGGARPITFAAAFADYEQAGFPASAVLDAKTKSGWAVGGATGKPHTLTLLPAAGVDVPEGSKLVVTIEQQSGQKNHTLGHFRLAVTDDPGVADSARLPAEVLAALAIPVEKRTEAQKNTVADYYVRNVAPDLKADRDRLAEVTKSMAALKPSTVPIMKELEGAQRRKTRIQFRGNFMDLGDEVKEGAPAVFPSLGATPQAADRMALAKWLVAPENPLTARVIANRYWEQLFGIGIVRTSEEFGIQGELPSHPELLDWLATELIRLKWDLKPLVKTLVTSATYRQSALVTKELVDRDPDNRLLARGPRLRLTAEMVRDQALYASGLLSNKMYGPSVKPPQPALGINAAFGGSIDWKTSEGEDKYRRGLYTEWRRSNPYPAMSTFDAPNRDVCIVRRNRTNTPLQALVTLNDEVYIEAAQALGRRVVKEGGKTPAERVAYAFRLCLVRPPKDTELSRLVKLFEEAKESLATDARKTNQLATMPLGPVPAGMDATELAAWTVVGNVILNLDESLMKR
jgi:Protein of unknown function (DUF1553)/Protein of unknown function (DUF1549)/Planctomycete cytochrome C/F5/8 type C domain